MAGRERRACPLASQERATKPADLGAAALLRGAAARIKNLTASLGLSISSLGYYPNPLVPNRAEGQVYINHLKKVILAAEMLGLDVVNTFIGRDWTLSVEDNWPRFREVWPPLVKFAGEHGIRIGIENCPMLFTRDEWPGGKNLAHSPAVWEKMFQEIPDKNFGLNFDPSHLVWQRIDYIKPLREFAGRIFHVHAKDAHVDIDRLNEVGILATPLEFHTPKLPGLGDVNWGRFFSVLRETGYRGAVCVEVEDRAYEDSLEGRKSALKQSLRYLSQFLPVDQKSDGKGEPMHTNPGGFRIRALHQECSHDGMESEKRRHLPGRVPFAAGRNHKLGGGHGGARTDRVPGLPDV
jgi:sugar phosphate isomerase/epimerase